jgi:hypothetical protein
MIDFDHFETEDEVGEDEPIAEPVDSLAGTSDVYPEAVEPVPAPVAPEPSTEVAPVDQEVIDTCCHQGLPPDWQSWTPPVEVAPDSFVDQGYSTQWGLVEPQWSEEGQSPFPVSTETETTIADEVGPGHEADIYWGDQGNTQTCALYSVRSILSEVYGQEVDIEEIIRRAEANNCIEFDARGEIAGVLPRKVDNIFASFGIPSYNVMGEDGAWEDLNDALANDQRVVLALDSKEIDAGRNVGDRVNPFDMDHAVSVTGIDYERGVVIVNDSARGAGLEIPIETFEKAWSDSDYSMTITALPQDPSGGGLAPDGATVNPAAPGYAALPMTLTPSIQQV